MSGHALEAGVDRSAGHRVRRFREERYVVLVGSMLRTGGSRGRDERMSFRGVLVGRVVYLW